MYKLMNSVRAYKMIFAILDRQCSGLYNSCWSAGVLTIIALPVDVKRESHHFSHVPASFCIEIEQCSNLHQNVIPDKTGIRVAWQTCRKCGVKNNYGVGFLSVWHGPEMSQKRTDWLIVSPCTQHIKAIVPLTNKDISLQQYCSRRQKQLDIYPVSDA